MFFESMRGEKANAKKGDEQTTILGCKPTTSSLSKEDRFKNRDLSTLNMVVGTVYQFAKNEDLYAHMVRKYVYEKTVTVYWRNYTAISVIITLLVVSFIVWDVNRKVIRPLEEMSMITEFILNPDKTDQSPEKVARYRQLIKKARLLTNRFNNEVDRLHGPRTRARLLQRRRSSAE